MAVEFAKSELEADARGEVLDLSLEPVANVGELVEKARAIIVKTQDDEERGITLGKSLKEALEALDKREDELIGKEQAWVKKVQGWSRPVRRALQDGIDTLKGAINTRRRKIMEEQRRVEEEAERKRQQAEKKAEKKGEVFIPPPLAKTTQTQSGAAGTYRMVKRWKIEDEKIIPREYYVLDEKKINAIVKAGAMIPGIKVYEEPDLAIR